MLKPVTVHVLLVWTREVNHRMHIDDRTSRTERQGLHVHAILLFHAAVRTASEALLRGDLLADVVAGLRKVLLTGSGHLHSPREAALELIRCASAARTEAGSAHVAVRGRYHLIRQRTEH